MAVINKSRLEAIEKGLNTLFQESLLEDSEGELMRFAMAVDSQSNLEEYNWLEDFATMKRWVGERKLSDVIAKGYQIPNHKYEATVRMEREHIEDDKLGQYETRIRNLARAYRRRRRKDITDLLLNGHVGLAHDGVPFFSATHPNEAVGTQSNVQTGVLTGANFDAAVLKMELLVDHQGEPLDVSPDTLIVGPALRATVRNLFGVRTVSQGGDNEYFNGVENIIIDKTLGTSPAWYLMDSSQILKPFIVQNRTQPEFAGITDPSQEFVFMNDAYLFGVRARWGMGYGIWQVAIRGTGA
jgi:phage major head subunit gpT-like protein